MCTNTWALPSAKCCMASPTAEPKPRPPGAGCAPHHCSRRLLSREPSICHTSTSDACHCQDVVARERVPERSAVELLYYDGGLILKRLDTIVSQKDIFSYGYLHFFIFKEYHTTDTFGNVSCF
ncbi:hypothetical protein HJG60_010914 [Phyllostomus discolor]|uniref:Uncharacterized protein n=1 Tax=Phyllostomus discolor TaxID=89673 RepID=A0A834EAB7_9CHIR|nr:hypothetical protein HJG60_010914 [Phyllostomus discolor]